MENKRKKCMKMFFPEVEILKRSTGAGFRLW